MLLNIPLFSLFRHRKDDGIIEKVLLIDFICHEKLVVHLNRNVNFMLGQNGNKWYVYVLCLLVLNHIQ